MTNAKNSSIYVYKQSMKKNSFINYGKLVERVIFSITNPKETAQLSLTVTINTFSPPNNTMLF